MNFLLDDIVRSSTLNVKKGYKLCFFEEHIFFDKLEKELLPIFTREEVSNKIGGLFKAKTLSSLDALSKGPSVKIKIGKKVAYEKENFIYWLKSKIQR